MNIGLLKARVIISLHAPEDLSNKKGILMILVTVTMNVLPEKRKELLQTVHPLIVLIREERGCISCRLFKDDEDENSFALVEEWETQEDLDNHLRSDRFAVLLGAKSLLREPPETKINTVSYSAGMEAVGAARKGL